MQEIFDVLENTFRVPENEGRNKIMGLREAIQKYIHPEMSLCLGSSHYYPVAAMFELIRQYWGKKPNFEIIIAGMLTPSTLLVYADLPKKVTADLFADIFFTPGPNPIIQKAFREKKIEFEQWSVLTHPLQLMAGAMGIGFIPTKSLVGSNMEKENVHSFKVIEDPFQGGKRAGVLKALNPDICIMHGLAADRAGNTIFVPPYGEDVFGALASKNGVIMTVEKIVSTEFIRKYSHMVRVPAHVVLSVSEVPFGAHPHGMGNIQIPELDGYDDDADFMYDLRMTFKDPERTKAWVEEWILNCPSHDDYLKKLGGKRLLYLKGKSRKDSLTYELKPLINLGMKSENFTPVEMAIVAAARKIKGEIARKSYRTLLAGLGMGSLAAWLAYFVFKDEHYGEAEDLDLMVEMGLYGYVPRAGDPFTFNLSNYPTCKMLTNKVTMLGMFAAGFSQKCMGILGAAQIDKGGNINSTMIAPDQAMTGTGGANDIASGASEVLVVMRQSNERFLEKVDYISCPGTRVKSLVSDQGIFEKTDTGNELILTHYMQSNFSNSVGETVEKIKGNCGWNLQIGHNLRAVPPPNSKELIILRLLDPKRHWIGKLR